MKDIENMKLPFWLKLPFWIKLALNSKGLRVNIIQNKKTHMYYRFIKERFTVQCARKY